MKYQHRILGMLSLLAVIAYLDFPREKAGMTAAEIREIGLASAPQHHGTPWAAAL